MRCPVPASFNSNAMMWMTQVEQIPRGHPLTSRQHDLPVYSNKKWTVMDVVYDKEDKEQ